MGFYMKLKRVKSLFLHFNYIIQYIYVLFYSLMNVKCFNNSNSYYIIQQQHTQFSLKIRRVVRDSGKSFLTGKVAISNRTESRGDIAIIVQIKEDVNSLSFASRVTSANIQRWHRTKNCPDDFCTKRENSRHTNYKRFY